MCVCVCVCVCVCTLCNQRNDGMTWHIIIQTVPYANSPSIINQVQVSTILYSLAHHNNNKDIVTRYKA